MVKVDSEVEAGQIVRNRLGMQIFGMRSVQKKFPRRFI